MEPFERYLGNLDVVKESVNQIVEMISERISPKKVAIPLSGLVLFYLLFVKEVDGKKKKRLIKEPCRPDEEYKGSEHPPIKVKMPKMDNWLIIAICKRLYKTTFGNFMLSNMRRKGKFELPNGELPEEPTFYPLLSSADEDLLKRDQVTNEDLMKLVTQRLNDDGFHFNTISDYVTLYRSGKLTPLDVAKKIIACFKTEEKLKPQLKAIIAYHASDILKLAEESTARWRAGTTLSIFDGIPVAIKDEYILGGYAVRNGLPSSCNNRIYNIAEEKGLVKTLRNGGAIFIGLANMHQVGIGAFGINQSRDHGTSRNPYNTNHTTSGSSGGSGSAIAAGFCPVALGTDGGGSIRLPAATNGVVGLKATYGRYSSAGMLCNALTCGHTGPLCADVRDTALSYGFLAGKDQENWQSLSQPPVFLGDFENTNLSEMRIGLDIAFFEDCHPELKAGVMKAVDWLKTKHNATIVEFHFPEKEETYRALSKVILSEMGHVNDHLFCNNFDDLNVDVASSLKFGRSLSANEYITSARQRTRCMNALKYIFTQVDVIIAPLFGTYQPEVTSSREKNGYSNLNETVRICRTSFIGNLTGIPCIALPVDYSPTNNLPIPVQIMAPWWREDLLLRVAYAIESNVKTRKPKVYYDIFA